MFTHQELVDLVYRIETAEAEASQARMEGRQAYRPSGYPFEVAQSGRTRLLSAPRSRRDSFCNRALAFSTEDRERLGDILQWLRERQAYFFDVASVLVDGPILQALVEEGYHATNPSNVLLRRAKEIDDLPAPDVEVGEIDLEDSGQVQACSIVRNRGLKLPAVLADAGQRTFRAEYAGPAWRIYLAYHDGKPAALAYLYIAGDVATIDDLADIPQLRGRGCRAALLKRCVTEAAQAGCAFIAARTNPEWDLGQVMMDVDFEVIYEKRLYSRETRADYDQ